MYDMSLYPDELIPQIKYKPEVSINDLRDKQDFLISRRIDGIFEDCTYIQGGVCRLKDDALDNFDEQLSLNMLGTGFMIDHTKFRQVKPASDKWNGEIVDKFKYAEQVEFIEPSFAAIYLASKVHQKRVPYDRTFDKKSYADDLEKKLNTIQDVAYKRLGDKEMQLNAVVTLDHDSTNVNYWHIVMRLQPSECEEYVKNVKAVWRQTMMGIVRDEVFRVILRVNDDEVINVDKSFFVK